MATRRNRHARLSSHRSALACICATLAGVACGSAAHATETGTTCFIEGRGHSGGMLMLEAVVEAGATGFDGSYQLEIETMGGAGRSRSVQAGDVHLAPGERRGLGTVTIGSRGMQLEALLTVTSATGAECTARF